MKTEFLRRLLGWTDKLNKERVIDVLLEVVEERNLMRLLFDTMVEGMIVISPDHSIGFVNETAARTLRIPDGCKQQSIEEVLASTNLLEFCKAGIDRDDAIRDREITIRANGEDRMLRMNILPLRDQQGQSEGVMLLFIDITEQRLQEARLRRAEKLAALTTLSAGVTHETGPPLSALGIHLQILKRQLAMALESKSQEIDKTVDVLEREVKRLNDVMEMFLEATRPVQPKFRRHALYDLIIQTVQLLRPELESRKIDIQLIEEADRPMILADDQMLSQVFISLIKCAAEAIEDAVTELGGEVDRRIAIEVVADDEATTIHIRDTGTGMFQEDMERIFEPYFTTENRVTGLGLMMCERTIRQHGGQLDVQSEVGIGTQFTITFPPPLEPTRLLKRETAGAAHS